MPYVKLSTNVTITNDKSPQLLRTLSKSIAEITGKSENYVMVELRGDRQMCFAGSSDPLAYVECKSIGLTPAQAKALSASVSDTLNNDLHIPANRVYIEFSNCPANFWGWNGSTFG